MKIQELEKELNITRSNIRFYEKEGLINPPRKENGYREYSEDDIAKLKKIIIFRNLGISVADIKSIFDGTLSLQTAIANNIDRLNKEIEELNGAIEVCEQIKEETCEEKDFPQDHFWNVINNREKQGEKFNEIIKDCISLEISLLKDFDIDIIAYKNQHGIIGGIIWGIVLCTISGIVAMFFDETFWYGFFRLIFWFCAALFVSPLVEIVTKKKRKEPIRLKIYLLSSLFGFILCICFMLLYSLTV